MRIGLLDSGSTGEAVQRRRFAAGRNGVEGFGETRPFTDHGAAIAELIRSTAPAQVELVDAQIFERNLHCPPEVAAAALRWLVDQGSSLINMSWGMRGDEPALRDACAYALRAGVWLVAATPIRGATPAPARYPGVISATGDARCAPDEISDFCGSPADFGASPQAGRGVDSGPRGGSSFACARVCGALAEALLRKPTVDPIAALRERAVYVGPQTKPAVG